MLLFLILNILDCVTTYIGVTNGFAEGNFLLNHLFDINIWFGLAFKMLLAVVISLAIYLFKKQKLFIPLNIAFGCIIVWNTALLILGY